MMKEKGILLVITFVIVVALMLGSCTTSTTSTTKTQTQTTTSAASVITTVSNTTPIPTAITTMTTNTTSTTNGNWWDKLGKPQYGGTMMLEPPKDVVNFDPYNAAQLKVNQQHMLFTINNLDTVYIMVKQIRLMTDW
jgi:hypothetical protein